MREKKTERQTRGRQTDKQLDRQRGKLDRKADYRGRLDRQQIRQLQVCEDESRALYSHMIGLLRAQYQNVCYHMEYLSRQID